MQLLIERIAEIAGPPTADVGGVRVFQHRASGFLRRRVEFSAPPSPSVLRTLLESTEAVWLDYDDGDVGGMRLPGVWSRGVRLPRCVLSNEARDPTRWSPGLLAGDWVLWSDGPHPPEIRRTTYGSPDPASLPDAVAARGGWAVYAGQDASDWTVVIASE